MSDILLTTKLEIPRLREQLVRRSRLTEKLQAGCRRNLTLVSAPAGFGKSTLVINWLDEVQREPGVKAAWISLDEVDNAENRFLRYLLAALDRADDREDDYWEDLRNLLQSSQTTPFDSILPSLINRIAAYEGDLLLVLEDYHLIKTESIHDALSFLLENAPPQFHILLITREDPPLPLSRLRVRNQLTEVRATDLRFTMDESASFLNQVMGLNLTSEDIKALEGRTEGWIAGLQLAAISLQGQTDTTALIQSFTGSNRHVMDYLIEDVLSKQTEEMQTFLLQTSILDRLNGALCDTLTGQENSFEVLKYLDQRNLFVIALDNERKWYRYHHLFSELLRQRLYSIDPDSVNELHNRAMAWYEDRGYLTDAIYHAFTGENIAAAVRLIEKGAENALESSNFGFIFNAIERIPQEIRGRSPWLYIYYAWALVLTGKLEQAAKMLADTDWLVDAVSDECEKEKMRGYLAGVKTLYSEWIWDDDFMFECFGKASNCLPKKHWVLGYCAMTMGVAHWGIGEMSKAIEHFRQAEEIGKVSGHARVTVVSKMYLSHAFDQQGRLHQARDLCADAFSLTQSDGKKMPLTGYLNIYIARPLYQLNELEKATEHVREGISFCRRLGDNRVEKLGHYQLAHIYLAQGNIEAAERTLEVAKNTHPGKAPLIDMRGMEYPQVMVWLAQKRFRDIEAWLQNENLDLEAITFFKARLIYTMHARALIALGREYGNSAYLDKAQVLLQDLLALLADKEWKNKHIEVLVLQALALQAQKKMSAAVKTLEEALRLAELDGFVRIFVDEGEPMESLLKMIIVDDKRLKKYISRLLLAFGDRPVPMQPLVEPLSERELEVLEKIAEGLTNAEVASQLYLSPNTVKVHTRNIFQKLGSSNRTQAVTQARELGIMSATK